MAIDAPAYDHNGEEGIVRWGRGTDWLIQSEVKTQKAADALWEEVVETWKEITKQHWFRNS